MAVRNVAQLPLAIYTRVSEQGRRSNEDLLSHDLQRAKVEKYLDAKGLTASPTKYRDNNRSGGKMTRPEFDRLLADIEARKVGGLAVAYLDRFARTVPDALKTIERIHAAGGTFIALDADFDTTSPMGKAMLTISLTFAALQRDIAVEKAEDLRATKLAAGDPLGGRAPVGYEYEVIGKDSKGKDMLGWIIPSADFEAVADARTGFASGRLETPGQVADELNVAGVTTTRGKKWNAQNVRGFLLNPVYTGTRYYDGEAVADAAHDEAHDEPTQRVIERKLTPKTTRTRVNGEGHLFSKGLARCSCCSGALSKGIANGKYPTLRCTARGKGHASISFSVLEPWVIDQAFRHIYEGEGSEETEGRILSLYSRESLVTKRDEAQAAYAALSEMMGGATPPTDSAQAKALADAQDAVLEHDARATENDTPVIVTRSQFDALETVEAKRNALRAIVSEVVVSPGTKGKKVNADADLYERVTIKFHDGAQVPAAAPAIAPTQTPKLDVIEGAKAASATAQAEAV